MILWILRQIDNTLLSDIDRWRRGIKSVLSITAGCVILVASLVVSYILNPLLCLVLAVYFILNVAYSIRLKHVVIIDILIIAAGFVLRALAGGLVIQVPFTPWFYYVHYYCHYSWLLIKEDMN